MKKIKNILGLISIFTVTLLHFSLTIKSTIGNLMATFGMSSDWAFLLIGIIQSGASWWIAVYQPYLIPFLGTIRGILWFGGAGVAVGW